MEKIKQKKIIIFVILLAFFINVFLIMKNQITGERHYQVYDYNNSQEVINITNGEKMIQKFESSYDQIDAVTIHTGNTNATLSNYVLNYKILSKDKKTLFQNSIDLKNIGSNTDINIYFGKKLTGMANKELFIEFSTQSTEILSLRIDNNQNVGLELITTGNSIYKKIAYIIGIVSIIICLAIFVLIYFLQIEIHKLFIIAAISFGIIITFLIPVGNVPDEANAHITTAYHYSNMILGIDDNSNNVKERKSDRDTMYSYGYVDNEKFTKYLHDIKQAKIDTTLVDSGLKIFNANLFSFTYYLSAIGITVGRILGLNGILCLLLGRLLNYILFVVTIGYCLKIIPAYKEILAFISLLPITIQQAFSLSYDSIVITLAFLITTLTIVMFYENKLTKKQYGLLLVSCILVSVCKSFSYFPIVLAPISYFAYKLNIKEKLLAQKKWFYFVIGGVFIIFAGIAFVYLRKHVVEGSLLYLVVHPKLLYIYFRDTIYLQMEVFVSSALGGKLGLLHIMIYNPIMICYYILLFYIITYTTKEKCVLNNWIRVIFVAIFLICFVGILLAMYNWSYTMGFLENNNILGFQGRYMLPVMPILFIALSKGQKQRNKSKENTVVCWSTILNTLTIFSILITLG